MLNTYTSLFDSSLYPHQPRLVRYELHPQAKWVDVRLLMRQFSHQYVKEACKDVTRNKRSLCQQQPVMIVAQAIMNVQEPVSFSTNLIYHKLYTYLIKARRV